MSTAGRSRTGLVLTGFTGGLAVVFAAAFGLGRAVAPPGTTPAPAPAPAPMVTDGAPMTDMTQMTDMTSLPG